MSFCKLWICVALAAAALTGLACPRGWAQSSGPTLTNALQIRSLQPTAADPRNPAIIDGVVTFWGRDWGGMAVQDGSGAVWVHGLPPFEIKDGSHVRIRGIAGIGSYSPILIAETFQNLGVTNLPAPANATIREMVDGLWDVYRVRVRGLVEDLSTNANQIVFTLWSSGQVVAGQAPLTASGILENHDEVEVAGVCAITAENRIPVATHLSITRLDDIKLVRRGVNMLDSEPVTSLKSLVEEQAFATDRPIRVRGVVHWAADDGQPYCIFDGTNALAVEPKSAARPSEGDWVEVFGAPHLVSSEMRLREVSVRRLEKRGLPKYKVVGPGEAASGRLAWAPVEIRTTFIRFLALNGREAVLLRAGEIDFLGTFARSFRPDALPAMAPGDEISVRGLLAPAPSVAGRASGFEIRMRGLDDLTWIKKPFVSMRRLWAISWVSMVIALGALGWGVAAARKAAFQTRARIHLERQNLLERRYRDLSENATDWIITLNSAGQVTYANRAARAALGMTHEDTVTPFSAKVSARDRAFFEKQFDDCLRGDAAPVFEMETIPGPGGSAELEVSAKMFEDVEGRREVQLMCRDVTARRQSEAAAKAVAQRQKLHVERTPLGVIEWDVNFNVVAWNSAAQRIFGWSADEARGRRGDFIAPPEAQPAWEATWAKLMQLRGGERSTGFSVTRDRGLIRCEWYHTALVDEGGAVVGVASLVQDVTKERELAEEVRRNADQYAALLGSLSEAVLMAGLDGRPIASNAAAERVLGARNSDILRLQLFEHNWKASLPDGAPVNPFALLGRECFSSGASQTGFVCRIEGLDGKQRWVSINVTAADLDDRGTPARIVLSLSDITDRFEAERNRQRLETDLHQSRKMEALGTLAGGVAHDFNNLLTIILGNTELVKYDLGAQHPIQTALDEISRASLRGAEIVRRVLSFSQSAEMTKAPLKVSDAVREVLSLLRSSMSAAITVKTEFADGEPAIEADAAQIHQVILNLCSNAVQAMETAGGVLRVRVGAVTPSEELLTLVSGVPKGRCVCLSVEDTGPGMTADTRRRIFEPFFTTKAPGKGTGLGLSVVHGIVTAHAGAIDVRSHVGQGSRFDIYFPASSSPLPTQCEIPEAAPSGKGEKILLVDDEPGVLRSTQEMLAGLGYQVIPSNDPREAIGLFRADPHRFHLVVTDLTMPHFSGADLVREIHRLRGDIPVMVVTGYAACLNPKDQWLAAETDLVGKPFTRQGIARRIRAALAKGR